MFEIGIAGSEVYTSGSSTGQEVLTAFSMTRSEVYLGY